VHKRIDLKNVPANRQQSGFLPEERAWLDEVFGPIGFIDVFRKLNQEPDHYSWWSQRFGVRAKNIGWRIDYVMATPAAMKYVRGAFIWPEVQGSDHCPIGVAVDPAILG